jgi:murein DD-endopeptidase MepM/ murein hydrolase activator NlpD
MSLRSVSMASLFLFAPAAWADSCGTADFKTGPDGVRLRRPVTGAVVAGFGVRTHPLLQIPGFHNGLDFAGATGEPVVAAARGRVAFAEAKAEYGNLVMIDHGNGLVTAYGQLNRIAVKVGDCVSPSVVIGDVGATGLSSGPQLHFEVLIDHKHVDPAPIVGSAQP